MADGFKASAEEEEDACARFDRMQADRLADSSAQGLKVDEEDEEERVTDTDEEADDPLWDQNVDAQGLLAGETADDAKEKTVAENGQNIGPGSHRKGWKHVRRRCRGCSASFHEDGAGATLAQDFGGLLQQVQTSISEAKKCGKPQASHVSDNSVVLAWRPPENGVGRDLYMYEVQQAASPRPPPWTAREDAWTAIANPVDAIGHDLGSLHTCSWVVHGLEAEQYYSFRVRVANCSPYAHWSEPSNPFGVGLCNYSPCGDGVGGDTWTEAEVALFRTLDTPGKVQDLLDTMPMNQEVEKDVSLSALECVRQNHAHCLEGALLGAYILGLHGHRPMLLDLRANVDDDDHVVTPFKVNGLWGCLSVSNHSSLRFRNAAYRSLRELVISYFDDYMNGKGQRTLRAYSLPIDLEEKYGRKWWAERGDDGSRAVAFELDRLKHFKLFPDSTSKTGMRRGDEFMLRTTVAQREWHYPPNADEAAVERNQNR